MKKQFYLLFIILLAPYQLFAQEVGSEETESQFYIGGGFQYGFKAEALGIRLDAVYLINETFRAAFDFTYYFPESNDFYDLKRYEININAHYLFVDNEQLNVYALAGINYAKSTIESNTGPDNPPGTNFAQASQAKNKVAQQPVLSVNEPFLFGDPNASDSQTGLNIGIGAEYKLDFGLLFGELKFAGIGGEADQLAFGAGIRIPI